MQLRFIMLILCLIFLAQPGISLADNPRTKHLQQRHIERFHPHHYNAARITPVRETSVTPPFTTISRPSRIIFAR
ncbi:MAG: hypothetical protein JNK57_06450 [Planctomycetaceae bacterium]|jgi:hypothetical protein|nr:hypothetical protein [Planctomycetaceae bacterium]